MGGWPGWTRFPITPLCYTQATGTWMWYWRDRHLRCHRYDQVRPTPDIGGLLREIGHDQIAIFWQDVVGMSTETPHTVRRNASTYQFLPDLQHQDSFRRLSSRLDWPDGMPGVVSCKSPDLGCGGLCSSPPVPSCTWVRHQLLPARKYPRRRLLAYRDILRVSGNVASSNRPRRYKSCLQPIRRELDQRLFPSGSPCCCISDMTTRHRFTLIV